MITPEQFEFLMPLACGWAEEQEQLIFSNGDALTDVQLADARNVGVIHPERIRLLIVNQIPMPGHPALHAAATAIHLITPSTAGLTLRYGIYIRSDHRNNRQLITHEFVHTSQYERLGGFLPFLQQYLYECNTIGYPTAPMEQEAITTAARMMGS
ncbi:MAG: hypothetical protein A2079_01525 [Geobacteraceae bacterium GWC2_48_7]|nr:MAG: hypothetical protein A2079_01525 [Geobacteraceae bacterium GWC2_48_7]